MKDVCRSRRTASYVIVEALIEGDATAPIATAFQLLVFQLLQLGLPGALAIA